MTLYQHWKAHCILVLLLGALSTIGCDDSRIESREELDVDEPAVVLEALRRAIDVHGGLDHWRSFGTLEYDIQKGDKAEHLLIDLHSRQLLLTGDGYTVGFDGSKAWVSPEMEAFSGMPRFYSSLDFYFFGLPFLFADPGTIHESLGRRTVGGREYDVAKVSFESSVGDSPDDFYIPYFNPVDGTLALLLYTVTYRTQKPNERFSARTYDWHEVEGLLVPSQISAYKWDGDSEELGEHRFDAVFTNVALRTERPDPSIFEMPEGAEVDALPTPMNDD